MIRNPWLRMHGLTEYKDRATTERVSKDHVGARLAEKVNGCQ